MPRETPKTDEPGERGKEKKPQKRGRKEETHGSYRSYTLIIEPVAPSKEGET